MSFEAFLFGVVYSGVGDAIDHADHVAAGSDDGNHDNDDNDAVDDEFTERGAAATLQLAQWAADQPWLDNPNCEQVDPNAVDGEHADTLVQLDEVSLPPDHRT